MDIYIDKAEELIYQNNKIEDKLMILGVFIELYNKTFNNALKYSKNIANETRNLFINALEFCLLSVDNVYGNTSYKTLMTNFLSILACQDTIIKIPENINLIKNTKPNLEEYFITMSYIDTIDKTNISFKNKVIVMRITQILISVLYKNINNQYDLRLALKLKKELVNHLTLSIPSILDDDFDGNAYRKKIKKEIKKIIDYEIKNETLKLINDTDIESKEILNSLTDEEKKIYLQLKSYYLACYLPNDMDFKDILYELSDEINMKIKDYLETKKNMEEKINNYYFKTKVKVWNK